MNLKSLGLAVASCVAVGAPASAHHSHANYHTDEFTNLSGTVTEVAWLNPHVWLYMEIADEQGDPQLWAMEGGSPAALMRGGWQRDSLKAGRPDQRALPSRKRRVGGLPDGFRDQHQRYGHGQGVRLNVQPGWCTTDLEESHMRCLGLVSMAWVLLSTGAAFAQGWREYVSRDEFFLVGMPAEPQMTQMTYRAASGALLPAKMFVAAEGRSVFSATVVHYMNAGAPDVEGAVDHAVESFRSRPGEVTYDRPQGHGGPSRTHDLPPESGPEPHRRRDFPARRTD